MLNKLMLNKQRKKDKYILLTTTMPLLFACGDGKRTVARVTYTDADGNVVRVSELRCDVITNKNCETVNIGVGEVIKEERSFHYSSADEPQNVLQQPEEINQNCIGSESSIGENLCDENKSEAANFTEDNPMPLEKLNEKNISDNKNSDTPVDVNTASSQHNNEKVNSQDSNVETLIGTNGNDELYGNYQENKIDGGNGDDKLYGGESQDVFIASKGDDVIIDFNKNDKLSFADMKNIKSKKDLNVDEMNGKLRISFDGDNDESTPDDTIMLDNIEVNNDFNALHVFESINEQIIY